MKSFLGFFKKNGIVTTLLVVGVGSILLKIFWPKGDQQLSDLGDKAKGMIGKN